MTQRYADGKTDMQKCRNAVAHIMLAYNAREQVLLKRPL